MTAELVSLFIVGLIGGTHCVGMCGGLLSAMDLMLTSRYAKLHDKLPYYLLFNVGRLLSYALLGVLAGWIGQLLTDKLNLLAQLHLRILSGVFLILMGLYIAGYWRLLTIFEQLGAPVWQVLAPVRRSLQTLNHKPQAFLLGFIWVLLPCGLIYSALTLALATGSPSLGGLLMLAFALGTVPAVLLVNILSGTLQAFLQDKRSKAALGLVVIALGIWSIYGSAGHSSHHQHESPAHQGEPSHTPAIDKHTNHHH